MSADSAAASSSSSPSVAEAPPPSRSRLVPGAQHSTTPSPCSSSSRSSGAAASARRRPATSRRRRSASSGPNRPSGSATACAPRRDGPPACGRAPPRTGPRPAPTPRHPGRRRAASARTAAVRVVDDLEQAVAEHEIGLADRGDLGERSTSPGTAVTSSSTPASRARRRSAASALGLGSTTDDRASRPGQRHGPGPAAAADVQHAGCAAGRAVRGPPRARRPRRGTPCRRTAHAARTRWPTSVLVTGATSPFVVPPPRRSVVPDRPVDSRDGLGRGATRPPRGAVSRTVG